MNIIKKLAFGIIGLASSILGIICYAMNDGYYESNVQYGGDAYTGIQNAAAQTANNIMYAADIIKFGLGSILLLGGLALIVYALTLKAADSDSRPVYQRPAPVYTPAPAPAPSYNPAPAAPAAPVSSTPAPAAEPVNTAPAAPAKTETAAAPAAEDTAPAAETQAPAEPRCPKCGALLPEGSIFCAACGSKIQ